MAENATKAEEALKSLSPEARDAIDRLVVEHALEALKAMLPSIIEKSVPGLLTDKLGYSVIIGKIVSKLAKHTGDTKEDVLLKALGLYEAAVDANDKGERLAILGPKYEFVREITGFDGADQDENSTPEPATR
jgi:hypothetical protein